MSNETGERVLPTCVGYTGAEKVYNAFLRFLSCVLQIMSITFLLLQAQISLQKGLRSITL